MMIYNLYFSLIFRYFKSTFEMCSNTQLQYIHIAIIFELIEIVHRSEYFFIQTKYKSDYLSSHQKIYRSFTLCMLQSKDN